MASAATEVLLGEALVRGWGDTRAVIDVAGAQGEASLTYDAAGHGEWEWPYHDSQAIFRADLVTSGTLGVAFAADPEGGARWTLDEGRLAFQGFMTGTVAMGFTLAHAGTWQVSGEAAACYPALCLKPRVGFDVEAQGFDLTLGPANLEIGGCTASCELRQ